MLLSTETIKKLFKKVFVLLLIIEIILLVTVLIFFYYNTLSLSQSLKENTKQLILYYRDLFNISLRNKYLFLIEDTIFLLKLYEKIQEWVRFGQDKNLISNISQNEIESSCSIFGGFIDVNSIYTKEWYLEESYYPEERFRGTWYNGLYENSFEKLSEDDQEKLKIFCFMNDYMKSTVKKHLIWKDTFSVTFDSLYFVFSDSFFYKYPVYFNRYMKEDWTDTDRKSCESIRKINEYDPKCRPYYTYTISKESKIVITSPYMFASSLKFGNEICIKGKDYEESSTKSLPKKVLCTAFNFNDVQIFKEQLSQTLGKNRKIIIVYPDFTVDPENPQLLVVFTSEKYPEEYFSLGRFLSLNDNKEIDLMEIYYTTLFEKFRNSENSEKENIKPIYEEVQNFFNKNIKSKLTSMINNYYKTDIKSINKSNYKKYNDTDYLFTLTESYAYNEISRSMVISNEKTENIYLFPIPISYDYIDDYKLVEKEDIDFFLIYVDEQIEKYENVKSFYTVVFYEILIYFFFIITLKIMIWIIFGICFSCFHKGFFAPIMNINSLLRELFFSHHKNDGITVMSSKPYKTNYDTFLDDKITSCIQSIFKLSEYEDINECFITLKMLSITRKFKASSINNFNLNFKIGDSELHLENMIDAFFFLMYNIPEKILQDVESDAAMISKLIYINFVYKINSNCPKNEIDNIYEDINEIIEFISFSKHNISRNSHSLKRVSDIEKSQTREFRMMQDESKLKTIYKKLKENVQYRYCIYKFRGLDSEFEMNQFNESINKTNEDSFDNDNYEGDNNINNSQEEDQAFLRRDQTKKEKMFDIEREKNVEQIQILVNDFETYIGCVENYTTSIDNFKCISAHIIQAGLLFLIKKENEGIKQCIKALEKIKSLQELVTKYGKMTKLAYVCVSNLFFERILFLLSTLSERFEQKKTQFYLYCNIFDLGPVYDRKIRIHALQKLYEYIKSEEKAKKNAFVAEKSGFEATKLLKFVKHKIRTVENMTKKIPKNILLLFDLSFPLIKEIDFLEIIVSVTDSHRNFLYFACFDQKLYIYKNTKILERSRSKEEKKSKPSLFLDSTENDEDIINLYDEKSQKTNKNEDSEENKMDSNVDDYNNYYDILDFIYKYDYKAFSKYVKNRVDKAIKKVIKFYQFEEQPKNNNFLFVFTTIDSDFNFNDKENKIQISGLLFESKYTFILCIMYDERIFNKPEYKRKYENYKKFIEGGVVNGHIFLIRSFSLIKFIINCASPQQFKQFDFESLKSFIKVIDSEFYELENKKIINDMIKHSENEKRKENQNEMEEDEFAENEDSQEESSDRSI